MLALLWKSGPSGPRQSSGMYAGFSPRGRLSGQSGYFRSLFSNRGTWLRLQPLQVAFLSRAGQGMVEDRRRLSIKRTPAAKAAARLAFVRHD